MKKKIVLISTIGILLISSILIIVCKNKPKYIMQDGVMLAMTLTDGDNVSTITSFPDYDSGKYTVDIDCENGTGKWLPVKNESGEYEWKFVVEDISGQVKCNLNFKTKTNDDNLINVVETNATTNANGYRYSGKTPSNYVWFNNELWRIIGSIPTCTSSGCGTSENLVKIIRNETIGGLAYDAKSSSYTGAWGSNTLYTHLNTHYYATSKENLNGQSSAGCFGYQATSQVSCDYTEKGILSTSYYGQMVKNVYWNTGASTNEDTREAVYTNETATQTVSGYIGLMNASDYGYASNNAMLTTISPNWLYNGEFEWTSTQYTTSTRALGAYRSNVYYFYTYNAYAVRPVLYLDAGVYVISGLGTVSDPYILGT